MRKEHENRKLPVIEIVPGAAFYVDAVNSELTDTRNPNNKIHLLDMIILSDHLELLFDKKIRNVKKGRWNKDNGKRYEYLWLRPLPVYDVEGAKVLVAKDVQHLPKNLPEIDIDGTRFLWHRALSELLQADNPFNQIHKCTMDMRKGEMGVYFDREKKVVPFPQEIEGLLIDGQLPPHIRFVPASEINQKIRRAEAALNHPAPKRKGMRV